jgi:hypothetical protein
VRLMHLPNCSPILQAIYTNSNSKAAAIRLENGCRNGAKIIRIVNQTRPGFANLDWSVSESARERWMGFVQGVFIVSWVLTAAAACEAWS